MSTALGSDSPLKTNLVAKAQFSNIKLTRNHNHRELRRDMKNVSWVLEPDEFLELFVPEPVVFFRRAVAPKASQPLRQHGETNYREGDVRGLRKSSPVPLHRLYSHTFVSPRL